MTAENIKKAWNLFKKEAEKELSFSLSGSCYMNKKQIENRTGTITLCNDIEYDADIAYYQGAIDRVNGYTSWTAEEKARSEEHNRDMIHQCESAKATYGTKANEAETRAAEILSSQAFKKLTQAIDIKSAGVELVGKGHGLNCYQIRINY